MSKSCVTSRRTEARGMAHFDLVIRGGSIVDGMGAAPFEADIGIAADRIAAGGKIFVYQSSVLMLGYAYGYFETKEIIEVGVDSRCVRPRGHARFRRHPHPLRRAGDLGEPARALVRARGDDSGHGQLRRGLRALPAGAARAAHPAHGRRGGHSPSGIGGWPAVELGIVSRVPGLHRCAPLRHGYLRLPAARAYSRLCHGPARRRPGAGDCDRSGAHDAHRARSDASGRDGLFDLAHVLPPLERRQIDPGLPGRRNGVAGACRGPARMRQRRDATHGLR